MANYSYQNIGRLNFNTKNFLGANIDLNIVQRAVPDITLGAAIHPTPMKFMPIPGDSLDISDLILTFILDENWTEYILLFKWIALLKNCKGANLKDYYTDARLTINTAKQNSIFNFIYYDIHPYNLQQIDIDDQTVDAEVLKFSAAFKISNIGLEEPDKLTRIVE